MPMSQAMPSEFGLVQSKILQPARNAPPGMVANEQERRAACRAIFDDGRRFVGR